MFIVNPYIYGVTSPLLDTYSAAAAYSLRQLKTGVTSVVRVRRSSDSAESDFTATEITDGTLTTWTGANDGFVVTWYDQSGGGNNVTQATAGNQPKLVSSGSVMTKDSLPAVYLDGATNAGLNGSITDIGSNKGNSVFMVTSNELSNSEGIVLCNQAAISTGTYWSFWNTRNTNLYGYGRKSLWSTFNAQNDNNNNRLLTGIMETDNTSKLWADGVSQTTYSSYTNTNAITSLYIGYVNQREYTGYLQEVIIYDTDQSANRTSIESDINTYYSIY